MFLCGLVFASCGGNGAKPDFNEAKLQEFVSKLPDHFTNLNLDSTDYLKETTAYLQSDEFKAAAQSILDNPNASDGYKDCVRRSLKKVEDYFSQKQ